MDYLVLLDRKFPYRTGESFLENEINEIAPHFDRVFVYPSDPVRGEDPTRTIASPNVEVRVTATRKRGRLASVAGAVGGLSASSEKGARKVIDAYCISEAAVLESRIAADLAREGVGRGDVVCIYSYWLYVTAIAACMLKARLRSQGVTCAAVSRAHGFDVYEYRRPLSFLPQRERLLAELDRVYVCSEDGARHLRAKYPSYAGKISTSYLGTCDRGLSATSGSDVFRVVSCSRVVGLKRVDMIAHALGLLEGSGLALSWTHLGGGEKLDELRAVAKKLSWMDVDLRGAVPNSDVYDFYKKRGGDLFVNVSESEGLPVSIMEAISFGIPAVATAVGGTPEIVVEGVSGTLLDKDCTAEDLAAAILRYATMDAADFGRLRMSTRKLWEERYQAIRNYRAFAESVKALTGAVDE